MDDETVIAQSILDIFAEHALDKFHDSSDRLLAGTPTFLALIAAFVRARQPVHACLPSFPFKSANKEYKVLGPLPDKAEELALRRLDAICRRVRRLYPPGASITIISDGLTYNDLLTISDRETWQYGEALQRMARSIGLTSISFARIRDLVTCDDDTYDLPDTLREITYVANCTNVRRALLNQHARRPPPDMNREIALHPDTKLTYLGYCRFLYSDLKYIFPPEPDRPKRAYKRDVKYLAKEMLKRGYAFTSAIKKAFPNYLRLSIHESIGEHKVSISLLHSHTGFTTPWHCSVAQLLNGDWTSAPAGEFRKDSRFELVYDDGRPSHFREKPLPSSFIKTVSPEAIYTIPNPSSAPSLASIGLGAGSGLGGCPTPEESPCTSDGELPGNSSISTTTTTTTTNTSTLADGSQVLSSSEPYGKRLLPQIIDDRAESHPDQIVYSLLSFNKSTSTSSVTPASHHIQLGLREISARQLAQAIDKTAWWLESQVGRPSHVQPIGYIGPHDLRHVLLTYACAKVGYAALFLSPKNSTQAAMAVVEALNCHIWARADDAAPIALVDDVLAQCPMKVLQLPSLDSLIGSSNDNNQDPSASSNKAHTPYPYTKTFAQSATEPFCYLHTSGSTGHPKPIPWSHGLIGTMDAIRLLPPVDMDGGSGSDVLLPWTTDWRPGDRIYSAFPMSHGAGIIMDILMPALYDLHCILGPVNILPSITLIEALADQVRVDIWSMVPSLVDEVGETPRVLAKLAASKFICASGGPVSPDSAGKANKVIRVLNLTGTTEGLFIGNLVVPRQDWFWFAFHPYAGFEFKQLHEETYEHWIHRNQRNEQRASLFQGIFHTFPDKQSINFQDLYTRHPSKPHLWAFKGRSDDLVVLSNGYKIAPLQMEALISTHPDINGCLVIGSGKPQAALLIELKTPADKTQEMLDSIWATVQEANSRSCHKNQLLRDFITFAVPDKPFVRTDKGTVKRHATLKVYEEYIQSFYSSRESGTPSFHLDTSSLASIQDGVSRLLRSHLSDVPDIDLDANLFELGLDSLAIFAVIKTLRGATGLGDSLSTGQLYASPTLRGFSANLHHLVIQADRDKNADDTMAAAAQMKHLMAQHQARQSFKLNAMDYVNPNHYMGLVFYFPLADGIDFQDAFKILSQGLDRTMDLIPALGGKIMPCSEHEIGYTKGDLCVTIPPKHLASSVHNRLVFQDASSTLPSFQEMKQKDFMPSLFHDQAVLPENTFPKLPADIVVAQANFVRGGCILAVNMHHCCMDGMGAMIALKAWAENCRFLQGDEAATCSWLDPDSFNHGLPEMIHEQQGWSKPIDAIDPGTWGFLPFQPIQDKKSSENLARGGDLPPAPKYKLHSVWPLPRAASCMNTTVFEISAANVEKLRKQVLADPASRGSTASISDIVQAFFWRSAIRARRFAAEFKGQADAEADESMSILESPTDGRAYFSSLLPSTYMGSMLIMSRSELSTEELCARETSLGQIAQVLRNTAALITPSLIHDAFSLLQSLPDHTRFSTANMGLHHMHAMISNLMLFQLSEIGFGDRLFGNNGSPDAMRPQLERGNGRFRFLIISPLKRDGAVELVLGTFPEELEFFKTDPEFNKYAKFVDISYW